MRRVLAFLGACVLGAPSCNPATQACDGPPLFLAGGAAVLSTSYGFAGASEQAPPDVVLYSAHAAHDGWIGIGTLTPCWPDAAITAVVRLNAAGTVDWDRTLSTNLMVPSATRVYRWAVPFAAGFAVSQTVPRDGTDLDATFPACQIQGVGLAGDPTWTVTAAQLGQPAECAEPWPIRRADVPADSAGVVAPLGFVGEEDALEGGFAVLSPDGALVTVVRTGIPSSSVLAAWSGADATRVLVAQTTTTVISTNCQRRTLVLAVLRYDASWQSLGAETVGEYTVSGGDVGATVVPASGAAGALVRVSGFDFGACPISGSPTTLATVLRFDADGTLPWRLDLDSRRGDRPEAFVERADGGVTMLVRRNSPDGLETVDVARDGTVSGSAPLDLEALGLDGLSFAVSPGAPGTALGSDFVVTSWGGDPRRDVWLTGLDTTGAVFQVHKQFAQAFDQVSWQDGLVLVREPSATGTCNARPVQVTRTWQVTEQVCE
jgi:hypothetical protein